MAIAVRVPNEIKEYKEKLILGLNVRQIISAGLGISVCVSLLYFGWGHINQEIIYWVVILTALPIGGIGFFKYNGLVFENFVRVFIRFMFLVPRLRKYKSENAFRLWQEAYEKEVNAVSKRKKKKLKYEASLERTFLIQEAEEKRDKDFDVDSVNFLTVSTPEPGNDNNKPKKDKKQKGEKNDNNNIQLVVENVQAKQAKDPRYIMTRQEFSAVREWLKQQESVRKSDIEVGKKNIRFQDGLLKKRRKTKSVLPKTVQQSIPYICDYVEGMLEVEPGKFSKMYRIKDINYLVSHQEEQVRIFIKYGEFINYFSEDMHIAICIDNRVISMNELENKVFYKLTGDRYDRHRKEFNNILRRQIQAGRNNIQVEKYLTVTISADSPVEALWRFHKVDVEVIANLKKIGSDGELLSTEERLAIYHDKFRKGREGEFTIDFDFLKEQGISSKDYIAPVSFEFDMNDFRIEDEYYRCLFLNNLPASLTDDFLADFVDNDFPMTTTVTIQPVAQDKALRIVNKQLTGMEANKLEAEKKAYRAGYNPETINHNLRQSFAQALELLDDLRNKNQKMFFVSLTCMVNGSTKEELDNNVNILKSKARKYTCQLERLAFQQEEAMKVTMPFGYSPKNIFVDRTLTTESTSIFMPFSNQELFQENGRYYGLNQISRNLVYCDRYSMTTPSGFILGFSGSGKTFAAKRSIIDVLLKDDRTNVLIIDPENEYGDFARAFGGEIIKISADTMNYINPMEMPSDYGLDENDNNSTTPLNIKKDKAIKKKSEYIISIIERMISVGSNANETAINAQQKTVIDRCVIQCYKRYLDHDFDAYYLPTLLDLQAEFDKEKDSEDGRKIAEGVEYYTKGSMDIFSHKSNINFNNRLVVFNIRDLGDQLRQIALLIVFDFIWSRMVENKNMEIATEVFCDEIHTLFATYYSTFFLQQLFKRGRKYGLCITGITQNVKDIINSKMGQNMIDNSCFNLMLKQAKNDLDILQEHLGLSDEQRSYVEMSNPGSGLLIAEKVFVPFMDQFPKDSYLYTLMTTKFGEISKGEVEAIINRIISENEADEEVGE